MRRGTNLLRLADFNQAVVLDAVRRAPQGLSRSQLGRISGLTPQTISNIARRLIEQSLVHEGEPIQAARGKPRIPLLIDGCRRLCRGRSHRPGTAHLRAAGPGRRHLGLYASAHPQRRFPDRVIELVASTALNLVQGAGVDPARVLGLGVAAPGPIDVATGVMLDSRQLPHWHNVRLRTDLHRSTGLPVLLDKDATAAATAELRASPNSSHNFVFFYLGSGVGAGVVLNDEVVRGASNNIGEVGDIVVDVAADDLGWGRRGSLATACTPEALVTQAERRSLLPAPIPGDYGAVDDAFTALCELAYAGNQEAAGLIDGSAHRVATGLAVIVNLLDVDRIVLGGTMWSRISARYLALLPALLAAELVAARGPLPVEGSAVGEHVAAQGAAGLVLDHFLAPRPSVLLME